MQDGKHTKCLHESVGNAPLRLTEFHPPSQKRRESCNGGATKSLNDVQCRCGHREFILRDTAVCG